MTNYKIIANAQRKLHVCLWAERKEEDNNDDDYHYNITVLMMTTKTTTQVMASEHLFACVCVKISFPVVNYFTVSLLQSFSYISHMFQTLALM
jgi:hypothetical protein